MASIKEMVQKEAESFAKAQRLRKAIQKVESNIKGVSEISKEARKP